VSKLGGVEKGRGKQTLMLSKRIDMDRTLTKSRTANRLRDSRMSLASSFLRLDRAAAFCASSRPTSAILSSSSVLRAALAARSAFIFSYLAAKKALVASAFFFFESAEAMEAIVLLLVVWYRGGQNLLLDPFGKIYGLRFLEFVRTQIDLQSPLNQS
jgi:hypothetical protein